MKVLEINWKCSSCGSNNTNCFDVNDSDTMETLKEYDFHVCCNNCNSHKIVSSSTSKMILGK